MKNVNMLIIMLVFSSFYELNSKGMLGWRV